MFRRRTERIVSAELALQAERLKDAAQRLKEADDARAERIASGKRSVTLTDGHGYMFRHEVEYETHEAALLAAREAVRTGWLEHDHKFVSVRDVASIVVETYNEDIK